MYKNRKNAFTLVEVLIAAAISTLVLAMVVTVIISTLKTWSEGSSRARLGMQGRILRERLLYGIEDQCGLDHASRNSVVYTNNTLQFQDAFSGSSFTILLQANAPLRVQNASGSNVLTTGSDILLQSSSVTRTGGVIVLDLVLSLQDGQKTYTQPQQIRAYMLNE